MNVPNDITELAINELINNLFKQIDVDAIENLDEHRKKVLDMIAKIPSKDALIIKKSDGRIKLYVINGDSLKFKEKPTMIELQSIIEKKLDQLQK